METKKGDAQILGTIEFPIENDAPPVQTAQCFKRIWMAQHSNNKLSKNASGARHSDSIKLLAAVILILPSRLRRRDSVRFE